MATAPMLEERLTNLGAVGSPVRLDLSKLVFIDSTGVNLLVRMVGEALVTRWQLQIEPDLAPQVKRVITLMGLDYILTAGDSTAP